MELRNDRQPKTRLIRSTSKLQKFLFVGPCSPEKIRVQLTLQEGNPMSRTMLRSFTWLLRGVVRRFPPPPFSRQQLPLRQKFSVFLHDLTEILECGKNFRFLQTGGASYH